MTGAYYNESDPFAAQWLRNLSAAGHIAPGHVDERSIIDVQPADVEGFTQCHFFAGIGIWSHALRLAGWPDDRHVWTGSCPCQPFSCAGQRKGTADARHLWPVWCDLIRERRPSVVIGEQVASRDALDWIDHVQADMEAARYAFAAVDMGAAGVGAPHWRQRLWWCAVADADEFGRSERHERTCGKGRTPGPRIGLDAERMANANSGASAQGRAIGARGYSRGDALEGSGPRGNGKFVDVSNANGGNACTARLQRSGEQRQQPQDCGAGNYHGRPGPVNGFWADADWLLCRDGKWRPVEPGTQPLAHGYPQRVGKLRAYGNAICPQAAATFIRAAAGSIHG